MAAMQKALQNTALFNIAMFQKMRFEQAMGRRRTSKPYWGLSTHL